MSRGPRRWPFVLLLLGSLAWVGLVAGTAAGAAWLVPEGSGLAGPAEALAYGALGLLAGLALGALLAWRAGDGLLRAATAIAVAAGLLAAGLIVWRIVSAQSDRPGVGGSGSSDAFPDRLRVPAAGPPAAECSGARTPTGRSNS